MRFKVCVVVKSLFSDDVNFKDYVKIVKKYMVGFNVTISNRLKIMGFYK